MDFEKKRPTEDADIAEITRDILIVQQRYAVQQRRGLGRGTHTKGVCCRAIFEVLDLGQTVQDPVLRAKLARGVFARPGRYAATVRFANAASTIEKDSKADVRAMSFSIEMPAGSVAPAATRHDYTMNNAAIFPINDAHAFAALMRVRKKASVLGQLWAFLRLPFRDMGAVLKTAKLGTAQQKQPLRPYQQTRFWSNVPFLHGQDQAIKYSAVPSGSNAGREIGKGPLVLRDELVRHLTSDEDPASFDFRLQLLDTARMTHAGKTREASFWVENAIVDWNETEAPFHTVARLTLERNSIVPDDVCDAHFIDVTGNSLPDSRPIGSINRARWLAESSSRKARLAAAGRQVQVGAAPRGLGALTVGKLLKYAMAAAAMFALGVLGFAVMTIIKTNNNSGTLPPDNVSNVVYADQGWGADVNAPDRQTYYYTAQGAGLKDLRYSWFVNLEMPLSSRRLADKEFLRRFGFVVDDAPSPMNPDGLPVGFSKYYDREVQEDLLDLTCAACHTGQVNVTRNGRTTALRIDGGSAIHAFTASKVGHFVPTLMSSLASTAANPLKFRRFATRVLGEEHTLGASLELQGQLLSVIWKLTKMGLTEKWHGTVPVEEGYGRTDALTRISNTVFGDHLDARNYKKGTAPVNYPPVWNIWKFDWVQYNASVSQPMARNIGESMGTGAKYELLNRYGQPFSPEQRFTTSTLLENLHTIETTLRKLKPPVWNEAVLGAVDPVQAVEGKKLFNQYCVGCHGPFGAEAAVKTRNSPLKTPEQPEWIVRTVCVADIGTDPNTATNFDTVVIDIRKSGLTRDELQKVAWKSWEEWNRRQTVLLEAEIAGLGPQSPATAARIAQLRAEIDGLYAAAQKQIDAIDPAKLSPGAALSYIGTLIRDKAYKEARYTAAEQADRDGFGVLDMPQVLRAYKPRPLAGIWASAPFLHNGSVPTIWDLLSPAEERPGSAGRPGFRVGSREYDTDKLGLAAVDRPYPLFDTTKDGNSNKGHEFSDEFDAIGQREWNNRARKGVIGPKLTDDQKRAIIAHLKVRDDDAEAGPFDAALPAVPVRPAQCPPTPKPAQQGRYTAGGR